MRRKIQFPTLESVGFVHIRNSPYPYDFHGRYTKDEVLADDAAENDGWQLLGDAKGDVVVPSDSIALLEVLASKAEDLSWMSSLLPNDLQAVWLGNTWVNDEQLIHLARLTGIEWLDIQNNGDVTDEGAQQLAALKSLKSLGMHWTRIGDSSISLFSELPKLEYLDIWGCEISPKALAAFRETSKADVRTE